MRTVTQLDVAPERLYRPFCVPTSEAELAGPDSGVIELPRRVAWNIDTCFDVRDPRRAVAAYDRLLTGGSADDIRKCVNPDVLHRVWSMLHLPAVIRQHWLAAIPSLGAAPH